MVQFPYFLLFPFKCFILKVFSHCSDMATVPLDRGFVLELLSIQIHLVIWLIFFWGLLRLQGTLLFIFQCVMVVSLNGFVLIRFALLWNYSHNDGWCQSFLASCLSTTHSISTKNIYISICYVWLARFHHISHTHGIQTDTFRMEIVFLVGVWSLERNLRREGLGWVWVVLTKPDEGSLHLLHKTRQTDVSTPLIMTRKGHGYRVRLWQIWAHR